MPRKKTTATVTAGDPIPEIAADLPPRLGDVQMSFGGAQVRMKVPAHSDELLGEPVFALLSGHIRKAGKSRDSDGEDTVSVTVVGDVKLLTARQAAGFWREG